MIYCTARFATRKMHPLSHVNFPPTYRCKGLSCKIFQKWKFRGPRQRRKGQQDWLLLGLCWSIYDPVHINRSNHKQGRTMEEWTSWRSRKYGGRFLSLKDKLPKLFYCLLVSQFLVQVCERSIMGILLVLGIQEEFI